MCSLSLLLFCRACVYLTVDAPSKDLSAAASCGLRRSQGAVLHERRLLETCDYRNLHFSASLHRDNRKKWQHDDCHFENSVYFGKHRTWLDEPKINFFFLATQTVNYLRGQRAAQHHSKKKVNCVPIYLPGERFLKLFLLLHLNLHKIDVHNSWTENVHGVLFF